MQAEVFVADGSRRMLQEGQANTARKFTKIVKWSNRIQIKISMSESPNKTGRPETLPSETIMVFQALEFAHESEGGAQHETVSAILEEAID
ncbi:hypothetical protein OIDMADRAFT_62068 [Oidiodendron maius Zn]|uniref:Uncharacterized protein n=1 Tax=Oidiodendron maius (strain Zn) TaxID=913774 RepID=A0A0C3G9R9_OIDMZ|nr:hypothetical protein OIDMADRAFT_62068 [Oidiodendron maius Zn]